MKFSLLQIPVDVLKLTLLFCMITVCYFNYLIPKKVSDIGWCLDTYEQISIKPSMTIDTAKLYSLILF